MQNTVQFAAQAVAKLRNAVGVNGKADALHIRQHPRQRQFHLGQQLVLPVGFQLVPQLVQQRAKHPGIGRSSAGKLRCYAVFCRQFLDGIPAGRGVQQVGCQLAVKAHGASLAAVFQRQAEQGLGVKDAQLAAAVQQSGQAVGFGQKNLAVLHGVPAAVGVLGKVQHPLHQERQRRRLNLLHRRGGSGGGGGVQLPALGQLVHFQFCQKLGSCRRIACPAPIGFGVLFNGRIGADGAQHIGKLGLVAVVAQLGALPRLDGLIFQIVIDILQAAELRNQR